MAVSLRCWIPSPGVACLKPLGGSKVHSDFHSSEVDKMSTRNLLFHCFFDLFFLTPPLSFGMLLRGEAQ